MNRVNRAREQAPRMKKSKAEEYWTIIHSLRENTSIQFVNRPLDCTQLVSLRQIMGWEPRVYLLQEIQIERRASEARSSIFQHGLS
jgi:hypothetical protein